MCEKCDQIDNKIASYLRLAGQVTDQQTLDGIAALIKQLAAEKAAIGCETPKDN